MAINLAELIIFCLVVDWCFRRAGIPGLVGLLLVGVLLGPHVLGVLTPELLAVSPDLRLIALIVILLRAGLELSRETLNRVGRTVLLLAFVPAVTEGLTITFLGPHLLPLNLLESAMLGAVLAAVSPAVVVPLMIEFIEKRMGAEKGIPTLVLAASSIDDVFVIVVYSSLVGLYTGQQVNLLWKFSQVPLAIASGVAVGLLAGWGLYRLFDAIDPRATRRALLLLGVSILLVHLEHAVEGRIPFASLLAVMAIGYIILEQRPRYAHELSSKFAKIWIFAEIILFTMVGAQVDLRVAAQTGLAGAALVALGLVGRSVGTWLCLLGTDLSVAERFFVVVAYLPKATVQAAIGAAPLGVMAASGMNTAPGEVILAVAVLSILLTAPAGAWAISALGSRVLEVAPPAVDGARQAALESEAHGEEWL